MSRRREEVLSVEVERDRDGVILVIDTTHRVVEVVFTEPQRLKLLFDLQYPKLREKGE